MRYMRRCCDAAAMRLRGLAACFRAAASSYFVHLFFLVVFWGAAFIYPTEVEEGLLSFLPSLTYVIDTYCSLFALILLLFSLSYLLSCPHLRSPGHPVAPNPCRARPKLLPVRCNSDAARRQQERDGAPCSRRRCCCWWRRVL